MDHKIQIEFNEEDKEIDDILTEGINNIYGLTNKKSTNVSFKPIQSKPILHKSHSSIFDIKTEMKQIQNKVHEQENMLHSIFNFSLLQKKNQLHPNLSQTDIGKKNIFKNTRSILTTPKDNSPFNQRAIIINNNNTIDKDYNKKILQQETNMLWKEKYVILNKEYNRINALLIEEKQTNTEYIHNINCSQKKKEELNQLLQWQHKLININQILHSQYNISNNEIKNQNDVIVKLDHKLQQLRYEFQCKTPIEFG